MNELLNLFEKYINEVDLVGQKFYDNIWIRSNKFYVYFGEENKVGKTYALFSKKYFLTIELSKELTLQNKFDKIAEVIDLYREKNGLKVEKYQFWLPHCLVNNNLVETKLIAESYGVKRELALEYLIQYDDVFRRLFDKNRRQYMGLPLLDTYEEAENYNLTDNTKKYLKGLRLLNKLI